MVTVPNAFKNLETAAVREVKGKVEVYNGSTLQATYTKDDNLISIDIQRTGDNSKLFGFVVTQRVNFHIQDLSRNITITSGQKIKAYLSFGNSATYRRFPTFTVTEVNRDETTNELSVTGYDSLYFADRYKYGNLGLTTPTTIRQIGNGLAHFFNSSVSVANTRSVSGNAFSLSYDIAPFDVNDDLKTVLLATTEATQTFAFIDYNDTLTFMRAVNSSSSNLTITKSDYYNLKIKENKKLTTITYIGNQEATATTTATGTTQYIRNNKLLDTRTDLQTILNDIIAIIGNTLYPQFEMDWRGRVELEYGDKFTITLNNNTTIDAYLLDDTITYNGALIQKTKFNFQKEEEEGETQNLTIGEAFQTNKTVLEQAIELATAEINGANGGYVTIIDADNDGNPDNIFITDVSITKDNVVYSNGSYVLSNDTNCTRVLRINQNGLGISSGYKAGTASNGYQTAITGSGINASSITTGTLSADYITSGQLTSTNNSSYFDLDTSTIKIGGTDYYTLIKNGYLSQYLTNNKMNGGLLPTGNTTDYYQSLFYDEANASGVQLSYRNTQGTFPAILTAAKNKISFFDNDSSTNYIEYVSNYAHLHLNGDVNCDDVSCDDIVCDAIQTSGQIVCGGRIWLTDDIVGQNGITKISNSYNRSLYFDFNSNQFFFRPSDSDGEIQLGSGGHRWKTVFASNGTINTSDRNQKTDIVPFGAIQEALFDKLEPVTYKRTDGERTHYGFIAQDIEKSLTELGLTSQDFAGLCYDDIEENGETKRVYGLRYNEILPLCVQKIKKLEERIAVLEAAQNGGEGNVE